MLDPLLVELRATIGSSHSTPPNHPSGIPRVRCRVNASHVVSSGESLSHSKGVSSARLDHSDITSESSASRLKGVTGSKMEATRKSLFQWTTLNIPTSVAHFICRHIRSNLMDDLVLLIALPVFHFPFPLKYILFQ